MTSFRLCLNLPSVVSFFVILLFHKQHLLHHLAHHGTMCIDSMLVDLCVISPSLNAIKLVYCVIADGFRVNMFVSSLVGSRLAGISRCKMGAVMVSICCADRVIAVIKDLAHSNVLPHTVLHAQYGVILYWLCLIYI